MSLIALSVLAGIGWLIMPGIWRGRYRSVYQAAAPRGILASNRRGSLAAQIALSSFALGGWSLLGSHAATGAMHRVTSLLGAVLFVLGFVAIVLFMSLYVSGKPAFMVPPPMRFGNVTQAAGDSDPMHREE